MFTIIKEKKKKKEEEDGREGEERGIRERKKSFVILFSFFVDLLKFLFTG